MVEERSKSISSESIGFGGQNSGLSAQPFAVDQRAMGVNNSPMLNIYNGEIDTAHTSTTGVGIKLTYVAKKNTEAAVPNTIDKPNEPSLSASDIVKAIIQGKKDIVEKVQDPNFRFPSKIDGDLIDAFELSEAFSIVLAASRSKIGKQNVAKAIKKRNETANEYAAKMYEEIKIIQDKAGISTYKGTVDLLTKKKIKTPSGGKVWYISTLQDLQKRWQDLGLVSDKPKPR